MRSRRPWFLLPLFLLFTGCVSASQKANQLADQNLYKEVVYSNASQQGPTVLVLPPRIESSSYEFKARVLPAAIHDLAETELGKGNFRVVDRANKEAMVNELAVAVNLGNAEVARKFKKFKHEPPQWLVAFDIVDVQARSTGFRHLDKNMAGIAGATWSSLSSAEEQREWSITMRYTVHDALTGERLHEGQVSDKTTVFREIKGFMGFDQAQKGGVQVFRSVQSLVQMAVQDLDANHKLPAMAKAAEAQEQAAKSKGKGKAAQTASRQAPAKKGQPEPAMEKAQPQIACATVTLGSTTCLMPTAWKTGPIPTVREVAFAKYPNLKYVENKDKPHEKNQLLETLMKSAAGPLVTLTGPDGPIQGGGARLTGPGLDGRFFRLSGAASKLTPEAVQNILEQHFSSLTLVEGLMVETVPSKAGMKNILVYKYIEIERQKEEAKNHDGLLSMEAQDVKITSIPHYHNMAVSIQPVKGDLVVSLIVVREESFIQEFEGFKQMVASL